MDGPQAGVVMYWTTHERLRVSSDATLEAIDLVDLVENVGSLCQPTGLGLGSKARKLEMKHASSLPPIIPPPCLHNSSAYGTSFRVPAFAKFNEP